MLNNNDVKSRASASVLSHDEFIMLLDKLRAESTSKDNQRSGDTTPLK